MRQPAYRIAFWAGCGLAIGGMLLGVWQSVATERRLPAVNISNVGEIQALIEARRFDEAVARLGMTLALMPQDHHVLLNMRGNAYNGLGRHDDAVADFERAIALRPGFVEAHNNLGIAFVGQGSLDRAVEGFERALAIDPTFAPARQNLERALRDYEAQVGPAPADPAARQIVARARQTLGPPGGADAPRIVVAEHADAGASDALLQARTLADRFQGGELDGLHAAFSADFAGRMELQELVRFRQQVAERLGRETELLGDRVTPTPRGHLYTRWSRFDRFPGVVELAIELRDDQTVEDLRVRLGESVPETARTRD